MLLPEEMVAYDIGLDLLKYNYTPKLDPDWYMPPKSGPRPSPTTRKSNRKPSNWLGSSQTQDIRDEETGLNQHELDDIANSFTNAIRWIEIAKTSYEHMGDIVVDVCKALGNVDIQDIDSTQTQVAWKQDVVDQDAWIAQLIREMNELENQLAEREVDLKREKAKSKRIQRLLSLLEDHVCNPRDVVTKAQLYDEVVAKTGTITSLKLIHICVDYSAKMETILAEI